MFYQRIQTALYRKLLERKFKIRYGKIEPVTFVMKGRNVGFFSILFQVIGALKFCKIYGHNLKIDFEGGTYYDENVGNNWWTYYFAREQFIFSENNHKNLIILNEWEQKNFSYYGRSLSPVDGHALVEEVHIKQNILNNVLNFQNKFMNNKNVIIGIHYRGTDKVSGENKESSRVSFEKVGVYLEKEKNALFYVATDEQAFLDYMENKFTDKVISYNAIRSNNSLSIHSGATGASMYRAGEDALIDCILLSCCTKLIRTESNLSRACKLFNPQQKSIILSC